MAGQLAKALESELNPAFRRVGCVVSYCNCLHKGASSVIVAAQLSLRLAKIFVWEILSGPEVAGRGQEANAFFRGPGAQQVDTQQQVDEVVARVEFPCLLQQWQSVVVVRLLVQGKAPVQQNGECIVLPGRLLGEGRGQQKQECGRADEKFLPAGPQFPYPPQSSW